jgi:hypothetical protein
MPTLVAVLSSLQALVFAGAGGAKLAGASAMRADAEHLRYPYGVYRMVGLLEVAGAGGLIAGLFYPPLGIAAATGFMALMVGALISHIRAKDPVAKMLGAVVFFVLSAVIVILHLLT